VLSADQDVRQWRGLLGRSRPVRARRHARAPARSIAWYVTAAVLIGALMSCSVDHESKDRLQKLESRVAALESEKGTTSAAVAGFDGRIKKVEDDQLRQLAKLLTIQGDVRHDSIDFDSAGKGYSRIDSPTGTLFVSVEEVKPYADGSRIMLNIGNPSTATYRGFKMHVRWGPRFDGDKQTAAGAYMQWRNGLREGDFAFRETLPAGRWARATLTLSPGKPESLGYMEISGLETDELSLLDRKKR